MYLYSPCLLHYSCLPSSPITQYLLPNLYIGTACDLCFPEIHLHMNLPIKFTKHNNTADTDHSTFVSQGPKDRTQQVATHLSNYMYLHMAIQSEKPVCGCGINQSTCSQQAYLHTLMSDLENIFT